MTDHQDHDTEAAPTAAAELAEPTTAAASGEDNTAAAPTDHATELIETGAAPTPELAVC
jgi:hypothetical protein